MISSEKQIYHFLNNLQQNTEKKFKNTTRTKGLLTKQNLNSTW